MKWILETAACLLADDIGEADRMGASTHRKWSGSLGYYTNSLSSHCKGKRGELCVEAWADRNGVLRGSPFRDLDREDEADLILGWPSSPLQFDVKTWDERYWKDLGRCVAVGQLATLEAKAHGIVWCTHRAERSSVLITLRGWSWLSDIGRAKPTYTGMGDMRKILNHQLAVGDVRPMGDLLDVFSSELTDEWPDFVRAASGSHCDPVGVRW